MNDPLPSLEEQGIQQLYTPPDSPTGRHADRALVLNRLAKSLLLNFLDLVGILSVNPALVSLPHLHSFRQCMHTEWTNKK